MYSDLRWFWQHFFMVEDDEREFRMGNGVYYLGNPFDSVFQKEVNRSNRQGQNKKRR
jgi:hypothetical protein